MHYVRQTFETLVHPVTDVIPFSSPIRIKDVCRSYDFVDNYIINGIILNSVISEQWGKEHPHLRNPLHRFAVATIYMRK
jgi:hypothetical protein